MTAELIRELTLRIEWFGIGAAWMLVAGTMLVCILVRPRAERKRRKSLGQDGLAAKYRKNLRGEE